MAKQTTDTNLLRLSSVSEADIAIEFGDGTQFSVGETVWHNHCTGRFYKVVSEAK